MENQIDKNMKPRWKLGLQFFGLRVLVNKVLPLGVWLRVLGFVVYVSKMHDVGNGGLC